MMLDVVLWGLVVAAAGVVAVAFREVPPYDAE